MPSTNNGLERFNGTVKQHQTFYERKGLHEFIVNLMQIVTDRSKSYNYGKSPYQDEVIITDEVMERGLAMSKSKKTLHSRASVDDLIFHLFSGENDDKINGQIVGEFQKHEYKSFDQFVRKAFGIWEVTIPKDFEKWQQSTCTCPAYFQDYVCKHIVFVAYRIGVFADDDDEMVQARPLAPKKRRGRPAKAQPALIRQ